MLPAFWYAGKPIGLGVGPIVATVWKFFVASAVAGCGAALLVHIMPPFAHHARRAWRIAPACLGLHTLFRALPRRSHFTSSGPRTH